MARLTNAAVKIFREVNGEKGGLVVQISTSGGVMAAAGQAYYHARYDYISQQDTCILNI